MFKYLDYKSIVASALIVTLLGVSSYSMLLEPILASAVTDQVVVSLTVGSEITIDSPDDVTLLPALSLVNDTANGSTTWTVVSNDPDGYTLSVNANQDPALQSGTHSFADYSEATPSTPEIWSVTGAFEFGFSAHGADVLDGTWGTSDSCGSGGPQTTNKNYRGFNGATLIGVADSNATTTVSGTPTTVCFAVEQDGVFAPTGSYSTTITATAVVK